jgi:hypothetical protein
LQPIIALEWENSESIYLTPKLSMGVTYIEVASVVHVRNSEHEIIDPVKERVVLWSLCCGLRYLAQV